MLVSKSYKQNENGEKILDLYGYDPDLFDYAQVIEKSYINGERGSWTYEWTFDMDDEDLQDDDGFFNSSYAQEYVKIYNENDPVLSKIEWCTDVVIDGGYWDHRYYNVIVVVRW